MENNNKTNDGWEKVNGPISVDGYMTIAEKEEDENPEDYIFQTADLYVDFKEGIIIKNGIRQFLRHNEIRLLLIFLLCPQITISRDVLLDCMQEISENPNTLDNTLSVYIVRLRRAIRSMQNDEYIKTRNSLGYLWRHPVYKKRKELFLKNEKK